jgi:Mg2+ and Co2+ transporter CorA
VDTFAAPIAQIDSEVNVIDDQIYTTRIEDIRAFMGTIEEVRVRVLNLTRLLGTKKFVLSAFYNHHCEEHSDIEEVRPGNDIDLYIDDVQDHVVTMMASLKQFEAMLSRAQGLCLGQLDINTDNGRRRVVIFLGRVSLVTCILSVLNLICGLFSTNVNANTTLYATNSLKAWFIIIFSEVGLAILLIYLAKRFRFF